MEQFVIKGSRRIDRATAAQITGLTESAIIEHIGETGTIDHVDCEGASDSVQVAWLGWLEHPQWSTMTIYDIRKPAAT
jgi:hypothetical protein